MQQMLFARPGASPAAWTGSDSSSPRRVTFAVQNAPPSPVVYRRGQQRQRDESPYAEDLVEETRVPQRRQQLRRAQTAQRTVVTTRPTADAQTRARRPGWDDGVGHGSTLFDASLKKSLLFQPRAGDRRKEEETEKQETVSVAPRQRVGVTTSRKKRSPTPVRYRSGPSSVYAQQRQNVTHWPQRRTKDFVRQNIEQLTGRSVDARLGRSTPRSAVRESVFERLAAPRVSKALLRSHMLPFQEESEHSPAMGRSPSASSLSPPRPAPLSSPVLTIDPPAPDKQESSRSASPSPSVRRPGLGWSSPYSSPQRSQQSSSSRRSPKSSTRSSGGESRRRQYDSYPARVFGVLDREQEQRIGVDQILQGLRLLGLPATLNQISDYVYLIHEGRHNTIDLEEWEILVGTLDAASRPASNSSRSAHVTQSSAMRHSPRSVYTSQSAMPSRSLPSRSISERSPYSSYHSPLELNNNQAESESDHSSPVHILKHAAPAVHSLQVSISPLRQQAESSLRQIQQRQGSKLSLLLSSGDMAVIAQNSDMLATAILDDILLDTVQLLNDEDRQQSCRQLQAHQAGQLDDIMARILEIEREENSLVQQGLSLGYTVTGANCDLPTVSFHGSPSQTTPKPDPTENLHLPNLTLPLEVVMNLRIPDSPPAYQGPPTAGDKGECTGCTKLYEDNAVLDGPSITSFLAEHPVTTSILQGKRLQSIERRKNKFQHHRQLVESSLAETGMAQYAVIEILEEMLLDDLVEQTTTELNDTVLSMSDMLMISLL